MSRRAILRIQAATAGRQRTSRRPLLSSRGGGVDRRLPSANSTSNRHRARHLSRPAMHSFTARVSLSYPMRVMVVRVPSDKTRPRLRSGEFKSPTGRAWSPARDKMVMDGRRKGPIPVKNWRSHRWMARACADQGPLLWRVTRRRVRLNREPAAIREADAGHFIVTSGHELRELQRITADPPAGSGKISPAAPDADYATLRRRKGMTSARRMGLVHRNVGDPPQRKPPTSGSGRSAAAPPIEPGSPRPSKFRAHISCVSSIRTGGQPRQPQWDLERYLLAALGQQIHDQTSTPDETTGRPRSATSPSATSTARHESGIGYRSPARRRTARLLLSAVMCWSPTTTVDLWRGHRPGATRPVRNVAVGGAGPLPASLGYTYAFTCEGGAVTMWVRSSSDDDAR